MSITAVPSDGLAFVGSRGMTFDRETTVSFFSRTRLTVPIRVAHPSNTVKAAQNDSTAIDRAPIIRPPDQYL